MHKERQVIKEILQILYAEIDDNKIVVNPDKEWDSETLSEVAELLSTEGYAPEAAILWEPKNQITLVWDVDDIIHDNAKAWPDMTTNVARHILETVKHDHDCNYGVSWETLTGTMESIMFDVKLKTDKASGYKIAMPDEDAQAIITKLCESHDETARCLDREEMDKLVKEWLKDKKKESE